MERLDDIAFAKALDEASRKYWLAPKGMREERLAALRKARIDDLKREVSRA